MARSQIKSPDPLLEAPPPSPAVMDFPSHARQFNRFLNLVGWFVIHLAFLIPALYFFIIAGNVLVGTVLLIIAVAALAYGLYRSPTVDKDVQAAFSREAEPLRRTAHRTSPVQR